MRSRYLVMICLVTSLLTLFGCRNNSAQNQPSAADITTEQAFATDESDLLSPDGKENTVVATINGVESGPNIGLIVGIAIGISLLSYGAYYFRRKAKPKHPQRET